ncbi:hypothetical protein PPERSA_08705 [Pseudocohnilembus persalinus]|uniref:FY-rich, C-terminal n=1 Tax=Pseudocohnilembus persalinus TaxID=266149 RepID=A0A0V0R891_PSEPJ|nr:hypothetical protein PPERSA_08705 [Pseudocohnilembus persalinus]|eukprot:KRX10710.1 hypothetical protein PPERSA_08705 [Pseudocohnilembus persalinus]
MRAKSEEKIDQTQTYNKRQQLKKNLEKNRRKQQQKQAQLEINKETNDKLNGQQNGNEDLLQLDSIFENSNNKTFQEQNQEQEEEDLIGDIIGNENNNNNNIVFESDDEGDNKDKNDKENSLALDDQEQDIFQKVQNMSDDEDDSEEEEKKRRKNKKQEKKKKKQHLDDSYSFDENQSEQSDDSEELYSENSDFSPNENRRKRGGKKRGPVDMRGEPQQRKYRKIILSKEEVDRIKYPYDAGNNLILISPGQIISDSGYHSKYNYFPIGYKCSRQYYSCVTKDEKTTYISEILKGKNKPLFKVTAEDNPNKPVTADSSSQCWKIIAEAAKKLNYGQKKVSISGPEMFGLQNQIIQQILEFQPGADKCSNYYANQINKSEGSQQGSFENEENENENAQSSESNQKE